MASGTTYPIRTVWHSRTLYLEGRDHVWDRVYERVCKYRGPTIACMGIFTCQSCAHNPALLKGQLYTPEVDCWVVR